MEKGAGMTTLESLKGEIIKERRQKEAFTGTELMDWVAKGMLQEALEALLFFAPPHAFLIYLEALQEKIRREFIAADECLQERYINFLAELTLGLRSFLPRWNLQNTIRYGSNALTEAQIKAEADKIQALASELAIQAPLVAEKLLTKWNAETAARFKAEQASDPEGEAKALVGNSVNHYLTNLGSALSKSHLRRIAEMRSAGLVTELSNDYAAFLKYAMYLGASFVTCNPVLVDLAWATDPVYWSPIVDSLIAENPEASLEMLARLVTLEIVFANMRLLRPIFLITEGRMGCVSLQVNPKKHGEASAMISEALFLYEKLRAKLDGGVPNVVFKLPGTKAGLEACRALTQRGIGVNITVNFALFQHLPFARAIQEGQAIFSCLAHMSGRLAYPVRDELLAKLDELAAYGISEARAREAAAWSGVAVLKRLYTLLTQKGYLTRIKPLIASLRIYKGSGYENLPSAFPDITEAIGTSIITVFPNVRRAFDALPKVELNPRQVEAPVPDEILSVLTHSEIFKQAYYVADSYWVTKEDERFRPNYELTLEDEQGTATWAPVYNTLTEFCKSYDALTQRILGRKHLIFLRQQARAGKTLSQTTRDAVVSALTNFFDVTVRETLQVLYDAPQDPELALLLQNEAVRKIENFDDEIAALYRRVMAKHCSNSTIPETTR